MQIEAYKTPCPESGGVYASKWISYILRPAETGLLCPSAILTDPRFEQAIADLRAKQIAEFHSTVSPKSLEFWKTRVIPDDDPKMTPKERKTLERQRQQRSRILAQEENINDTGPRGHSRNTESNVKIQKLVHDLMLSQKFNLTSGVAAGKMFQHQFDKSILTDPDAERKLIEAVKAVRDCFPPNMPVVLSIHFDKAQNNPHIHGWLYDREWDLEKGEWGEINPLTSTVKGMSDLRKLVDAAVLRTTGTSFGDQTKKHNPDRPKRDVFTKKQAYWTQHFRGRQEEFLKGEFLTQITNPHEREAMRQFIAQRSYDVETMQSAAALEQEKKAHRAELEKLLQEEKVPRHERKVAYQDIEEMTILTEAASNPSPELQKMHEQPAAAGIKPGTSTFKPIAGYYRTKQYHSRLASTITSLYDGYSVAEKADEVKSIRASIAKIDEQLAGTALNETQRVNLEFTRDFEIKSLKYMKEQLTPTAPKPGIKPVGQPKPKAEPVKSEKLSPNSSKTLKL